MADGRLTFDTHIDNTGAKTGIAGLKSIIKVGLSAMALKLGKDIASLGIGFNAQIEQYQTSFEVLTGSADKAAKHVKDLKTMAAKTPFELTDLTAASQTIQAFGTDVEDTQDALKMLGDISLGNRERFSSLALVYGQVRSQGKLMGQDLLQMINAGFNPLQVISQNTGESMASLKDKMAKGAITFEMVEEAMKSATSEGGKFYQGMEKQSQTFNGKLSTIKDNVKELLGTLSRPIFKWLSDKLLPKIIKGLAWAQKHTKLLTTIVAGLGAAITTGLAISKFKKIASGIRLVGGVMKTFIIANPWLLLASAIAAAAVAIGSFLKNGGDISKLGSKIGDFIKDIAKKLPKIVQDIAKVLPKVIKDVMQAITTALPQIVKAGISIIKSLIKGIASALPDIIKAGVSLIEGIIDGITQALPLLIEAAPDIIEALLTGLIDNLPTLLEGAVDILIALGEGLIKAIPKLIEKLPAIIWALVKGLWNLAGALLSLGADLLGLLWEGIKSGIGWLFDKACEVGSKVWEGIKSGLGSLFSVGADFLKGLWNGIVSIQDWIVNKLTNLGSIIWNAIKNGIGSLFSVGKDLIKGLWNGIKSVKDWILDKIKGFGKSILKGIKNFFGIKSPSRVMKQIGIWIGQGLGLGIEASTDDVLGAVMEQVEAVKDAYEGLDDVSYTPDFSSSFARALNTASSIAFGSLETNKENKGGANVNQTFNFYEPHKTPHDIARALQKEAVILGLAGA